MATVAAEMQAEGIDIINFSVGEPDFNTPINIIKAAKKAMDDGYTKYTAGSGMIEFRKAICEKLERENGLSYNKEDILVSNGEKQSLSIACQTLFQKGDQVLVFRPYWVSFPEFVRLADAEPIFIDTLSDRNFEPNFNQLISKKTDSIKGVIINSPSNPTGGVWGEGAILELLKIAKQNNWFVISDECYEQLVYDGNFTSVEKINRDNKINAIVITCMSLSKTYSMTGWRIGYSAGPHDIIKGMSKLQGQATSCANSIGQKAGIEALNGDQGYVIKMKKSFKKRRDLIISLLKEIPDVSCATPRGAFYVFPDFSKYINRYGNKKLLKDTFDLSDYILEEAKVITVPGDGFGASGHIRFSYAINSEAIKKGINKLKLAIEKII
tara:strand:- start:1007 stop:2152 length:1146 start_codon:yes stop_codon:yes gene_type:complete